MSLNWARPGLGAVGEYQASGTPLVLNSADTYNLNYYTRAITVFSTDGNNIATGLTIYDGEDNGRAITVPAGASVRLEIRCKKIAIASNVNAVVELTNIHHTAGDLPTFASLTF